MPKFLLYAEDVKYPNTKPLMEVIDARNAYEASRRAEQWGNVLCGYKVQLFKLGQKVDWMEVITHRESPRNRRHTRNNPKSDDTQEWNVFNYP